MRGISRVAEDILASRFAEVQTAESAVKGFTVYSSMWESSAAELQLVSRCLKVTIRFYETVSSFNCE